MSEHTVLISPSGRSTSEYRIFSAALQEQTLAVLGRVDRPGVVALGERRGDEYYITIESEHLIDLMHSQRVVKALAVVFHEVLGRQVEMT